MAENGSLNLQFVEYLAAWPAEAKIGSSAENQPVVVITVRPEPETTFRSHNAGFTWAQARRLCDDLTSIFQSFGLLLLLALITFAGGCSARYEAREETKTDHQEKRDFAEEKAAVKFQFDLLQNAPPAQEPKTEPRLTGTTVNISGGTTIIVVPGGGEQHEEANKKKEHTGLNTKIGWPSVYLEHGDSVVGRYVAVLLLVGTAVAMMISTCKLKSGGPLYSSLALLVLAAVLLQTLPPAEAGFQFIPLSPWAYLDFISVSLSVLCWIGLAVAACALTGCLDSPSLFSAAVLFAMGCNLLLSFVG